MQSLENENMVPEQAWEDYLRTRDQELRNRLVLFYSGLVRQIAMRMRGVYKNFAQMDDVVNQGIIALIDAVEKYEPARGIKFETFASIKVKGAVIDYIRSQDWIPRRVRKVAGQMEETYNQLYSELNRPPTNREVAAAMQVTPEQLDRLMEQTYNFNLLSYEEVVWQRTADSADLPVTDSVEDSPERKFMEDELRKQLATSIDALGERERTVVSLYYYDKLKLKEISEILGVTESRVCQIHSAAILKMKKRMKQYITE